MKTQSIEKIEETINPIIEELGLELVAAEYAHEIGGLVLRVFIDKSEGISISDCTKASRSIEDVIEIEDFIQAPYRLEVSSPGWDRPIKQRRDFDKFKDCEIKLESIVAVEGRRRFRGTLLGMKDNDVIMNVDEKTYTIDYGNIKKAKLVPNEKEWKKGSK